MREERGGRGWEKHHAAESIHRLHPRGGGRRGGRQEGGKERGKREEADDVCRSEAPVLTANYQKLEPRKGQ